MKICVIGTGYVGLVAGVVFADLGNKVIGVDSDADKIKKLRKGKMPIYEPGLEEMARRNINDGRLYFSNDLKQTVEESELIFICVGTPSNDSGEADLSQVEAAAREVARAMNGYKIVVNKSTVPVGTGDLVSRIITEERNGEFEFDVVSNPEFLREGSAIKDMISPDRIIVGVSNHKVAEKFIELYSSFQAPIFITDIVSAEMIKYASNTFLANRISFMNTIADLCEAVGADVTQVANGIGLDHRIGHHFLQAGLGFGGSCFPKDIDALIETCRAKNVPFQLLEEIRRVNRDRVPRFFKKITRRFGDDLRGKVFAVLGLAFKPDTDDLREAKSLELISLLLDHAAEVRAYDPVAMEKTRPIYPQVVYCDNPYEAARGADAVVLVTEWREFQVLDLVRLKKEMRTPVIFDGRNLFDPTKKRKAGFEIYSVGRP